MEILIFGLVLIILGVGSTILYDKYKNEILSTVKYWLDARRSQTTKVKSRRTTSTPTRKQSSHKPINSKEIEASIKQAKAELQQLKKELEQKRKRPVKTQQVPSNLDEQLKALFDSMNIEK